MTWNTRTVYQMFYCHSDPCKGCTAVFDGHMNTKCHYYHHNKDLHFMRMQTSYEGTANNLKLYIA